MSDDLGRRFLEEIVAHPDDDTQRLIFADWLEEQGDSARAEFIRVQIERTRLPEWDARQVRLRLREQALLKQYERKWKQNLPRMKGVKWTEFRRGFVGVATFNSFAVLKAQGCACAAVTPLEGVSVRWPRQSEGVEKIEPMPGLRELTINTRLVDHREMAVLANAPILSTLRSLSIPAAGIGAGGFAQLVDSPHLGNLRALRVPQNSIGNNGVQALFDAASLTSLEELDLSEAGSYGRYDEDPFLEAYGLAALAAWSGMSRIRSLNLSGNAVGRGGLRALLGSPFATGLKTLGLRSNGLDSLAVSELAGARPELQLDLLDLGDNVLRHRGAAYVASATGLLRDLKVLELDRCEINSTGARAIAKVPFLATLQRLNVNYNSFFHTGLLALLKQNPQKLHTLHISNNDLGDKGVAYLVDSPASDNLLELNLCQNNVGPKAARLLGKTNHLQKLLVLTMFNNPLQATAVAALRQSPLGKRLSSLVMDLSDVIPF